MTNLNSILKSRDITLPTKVHLVKAMVFPVVMYECESSTIKKAEHQRIDTFELWCWRRLLRVPWTARRSNLSILKEISPEYSLEGLMLRLKLQYFGHLVSSKELTHWKRPWYWERLKTGGQGNDRGWDAWMASPTRWTWVCVGKGSWWWTGRPGVLQSMGSQSQTRLSDWTEGPGVKSLISWELIFGVVWNRVQFHSFTCEYPVFPTLCIEETVFLFEYSGFHELSYSQGSPGSSAGKESTCNAGDPASIPRLGRSPGEGHGYPFQYSGLENSMDCMGLQRVGHEWATLTFQQFTFAFYLSHLSFLLSLLSFQFSTFLWFHFFLL